jgi:hypothetical protein
MGWMGGGVANPKVINIPKNPKKKKKKKVTTITEKRAPPKKLNVFGSVELS